MAISLIMVMYYTALVNTCTWSWLRRTAWSEHTWPNSALPLNEAVMFTILMITTWLGLDWLITWLSSLSTMASCLMQNRATAFERSLMKRSSASCPRWRCSFPRWWRWSWWTPPRCWIAVWPYFRCLFHWSDKTVLTNSWPGTQSETEPEYLSVHQIWQLRSLLAIDPATHGHKTAKSGIVGHLAMPTVPLLLRAWLLQ